MDYHRPRYGLPPDAGQSVDPSIVVLDDEDLDLYTSRGGDGKLDFSHLDLPSPQAETADPISGSGFESLPKIPGNVNVEDILSLVVESNEELQKLREENLQLTKTLRENNEQVPQKLQALKQTLEQQYSNSVAAMKSKVHQLHMELTTRDAKIKQLQAQINIPSISPDQHKIVEMQETNEDLKAQLRRMQFDHDALVQKLKAEVQTLSAKSEVAAVDPYCVQIQGVSENLTHETLQLFFELERRSGGGDLDHTVIMRPWEMAWIRFVDPTVAARVLDWKEELKVNSVKLKATPLTSLLVPSRPTLVTEKQLEDYFQDLAMASGGTLVNCHFDNVTGGTFMQFNNNAVATTILSHQHVLSMAVINLVPASKSEVEEIIKQAQGVGESRVKTETFIELQKELEVELETEQSVWQVAKRHYDSEFGEIQDEYRVSLKERPGNDDAVKIMIVGKNPSGGQDQLNRILGQVSKRLVLQGIDIRKNPIPREKLTEEISKVQKRFNESLFIRYSKLMGYVTIAGLDETECLKAKSNLHRCLGISEEMPGNSDDGARGGVEEGAKNREEGRKKTSVSEESRASLSPGLKLLEQVTLKNGLQVSLYEGDITKITADVIVNAANTMLMHGGGVARAISKAAGNSLIAECRDYIKANKLVPMGHVVPTTAGNLNASYVLHAVGPRWDDYQPRDKMRCSNDVFVLFSNILKYAEEKLKAKSIAIPGVSSGVFGVPRPIVAKAMYDATVQFDTQTRHFLQKVTFITIDPEMNSWLTAMCLEQGNIDPMIHLNNTAPKANSKSKSKCKMQ